MFWKLIKQATNKFDINRGSTIHFSVQIISKKETNKNFFIVGGDDYHPNCAKCIRCCFISIQHENRTKNKSIRNSLTQTFSYKLISKQEPLFTWNSKSKPKLTYCITRTTMQHLWEKASERLAKAPASFVYENKSFEINKQKAFVASNS